MPEVKVTDHYVLPLKKDFEEFLARFQQTDSVRYEHFSAVWRGMNFSSIHYGLPIANEKRHFSKSALTSAYDYLLPPYNFQIRVGGLYLLYGLFTTQLAWPREKICVALKDWDDIQKFIQNAWEGEHMDVVYVYWKLLASKAFFFSAMPLSLFFERKRTFPKQEQDLPTERSDRVKNFVFSNITREMKCIQDRYEKMKVALSLTSTVNATQRDLIKKMQDCAEHRDLSEHASGDCADSAEALDREESSKRAQLLASIKSKSYGTYTEALKSRRHRQTECEVTSTTSDPSTDPYYRGCKKKRYLSLKSRACQIFGEVDDNDPKQHWLLCAAENDRRCLKRIQKNRFLWREAVKS